MSGIREIDHEAAERLLSPFMPMFAEFERRGVGYCLVGGLAVVAQCLVRDGSRFRATHDADALVPQDYSNAAFASDYLRVYAANPEHGRAVYGAVFGEGGFDRLGNAENAFVNASFVGADEDLDGVDTPDFYVCRTLNGRTLESIRRERIEVLGQALWVATVEELLDMKRGTIAIYGADIQTSPRPQDFVDVGILNGLVPGGSKGSAESEPDGLILRIRRVLGGNQ